MSRNRVIGKNNELPWNIPEELKWFKEKTLDQVILMGRKTFDSIGRPLPRRESLVLSRSMKSDKGISVIHDVSSLSGLGLDSDKDVWVIGGAEVYSLTLPYCSDLFLTHVNMDVSDGDAFFPDFEDLFQESSVIEENEKFTIVHYVNKFPKSLG